MVSVPFKGEVESCSIAQASLFQSSLSFLNTRVTGVYRHARSSIPLVKDSLTILGVGEGDGIWLADGKLTEVSTPETPQGAILRSW